MIKIVPTLINGVIRAVTSRRGRKIVRKIGDRVTEKSSVINVREAGEPMSTEVIVAYVVRAGLAVVLIKVLALLGIDVSQFFEFLERITEILE